MTDHICEKYDNLKQLRFIKISKRHTNLIQSFQTSNKELKDFLIEDAFRQQKMCVSTTWLVFDSHDFAGKMKGRSNPVLLGYVTITNDSISLNSDLKQGFRDKGVNYKSLPALKIGRVCVDARYERRGIGTLIVAYCISRAIKLNNFSACRFITLDAKRSSNKELDSLHFYIKLGFNVLPHKDKSKDNLMKQSMGETPMYLDIYHIAKQVLKLDDP